MISFNILDLSGHGGVLDLPLRASMTFTRTNPFHRFCDISLGRSVSFDAPATDKNRYVLGYEDEFVRYGEAGRRMMPCDMVYDGGVDRGMLEVTGFSDGNFHCIYYIGYTGVVETLMGKPMKDCAVDFKGVVYGGTPEDADNANPVKGVENIKYDNGLVPSYRQLTPSVNIASFVEKILASMTVPTGEIAIPRDYWMVAESIHGGADEDLTLVQTSTNTASVTPSNNYIEVVDITLEWAENYVFGAYLGGGSQPAKAFKAKTDIAVTFPADFPAGVYLVQWSDRLGNCKTIGGVNQYGVGDTHTADGNPSPNIRGVTVSIPKGSVFFFAPNKFEQLVNYSSYLYGYMDNSHPLSVDVTANYDGDLSPGDIWMVQNNMPDMTVFEFLKSVCLALGLELSVDGDTVAIGTPYISGVDTVGNAIGVDSVSRCVGCWGSDVKVAEVGFDSADYVTQPIRVTWTIDSDRLKGKREATSMFSEGQIGANGVAIYDVEEDNGTITFRGGKWTIAKAVTGLSDLQRIDPPAPPYYDAIAAGGTCIEVSFIEELRDFMARRHDRWITFRGGQFVWTDAVWSDGITKITLQKV